MNTEFSEDDIVEHPVASKGNAQDSDRDVDDFSSFPFCVIEGTYALISEVHGEADNNASKGDQAHQGSEPTVPVFAPIKGV